MSKKTTEPTLAEAITNVKNGIRWAEKVNLDTVSLKLSNLRRLVEAGEFEKKFTSKEWCIDQDDYERCPSCRPFLDRIEELTQQSAEKDQQIQALRGQLDALGKEQAEVEEKLRETTHESLCWSERTIESKREAEDLRSQLAEKERLRAKDTGWAYSPTFLAKLKIALESVDKGDYKSFETMGELIEHLQRRAKDPAPTEPEVEKVAENLYLRHTTSSGLIKKAFCVLYDDEKIRWRSVARHVIERGYRREE